jgi:hypothetical protein
MRTSFTSRSGFVLAKSPSYRQQAARRRMMVICAVLGLALASGLIGTLTASHQGDELAHSTGPFSYFPHS